MQKNFCPQLSTLGPQSQFWIDLQICVHKKKRLWHVLYISDSILWLVSLNTNNQEVVLLDQSLAWSSFSSWLCRGANKEEANVASSTGVCSAPPGEIARLPPGELPATAARKTAIKAASRPIGHPLKPTGKKKRRRRRSSDRGLSALSFSPHRTSGQLYTTHGSEAPQSRGCTAAAC